MKRKPLDERLEELARIQEQQATSKPSYTISNSHLLATLKGWSIDTFKECYEAINEIETLDLKTRNGLDSLVNITGNSGVGALSLETREKVLKDIHEIAKAKLAGYTITHADKLVESLKKEEAIGYVTSNPSFPASNNQSYNTVSESLNENQRWGKILSTEEGREEYIKTIFSECNEITKQIWEPFTEEVIEGDLRNDKKKAERKLVQYGVEKFVQTNLQEARRLESKLIKETNKLDEEIQLAIQQEEASQKRDLTEYEKIDISDTFNTRREEMATKYELNLTAAKELPRMIEELQELTYQRIINPSEEK